MTVCRINLSALCLCQLGAVGLRELPISQEGRGIAAHLLEHLARLPLELAFEDVLALEGPFDLPHIERVHAGEPVEVRCIEGSEADSATRFRYSVRETGGDRKAVRAADRSAGDGELTERKMVCNSGDIGKQSAT